MTSEPAQVFILNESHPENIEIQLVTEDYDDGFGRRRMASAHCPRCRHTSTYDVSLLDGDEKATIRAAVRQLAEYPCKVHIGHVAREAVEG